MAGFGFSETQEMFRTMVRDFARKELVPGAKERAKMDSIPWEILKRVGEMGLIGVNLPAKYGGQPADWVTVGIMIEELAKVDFCLSLAPILPAASALILEGSTEDVRQEWLPPLIKGEKMVSLAITEPDCGSDAAAIKARATRDGEYYIINGEKTSITFGMQSNVCMLFVTTNPDARARGVTCFFLPLDLPGISRSRFIDMGCNPLGRASIMLDDVRVPARYRVGEEGKGFYLVMSQFDFIRVLLGLMTIGIAETSLDDAITYAKQRTAFGQPIGKFEAVSFKIAEDATMLEAARLLCYRTLYLRDEGLPHTKESAMCKWLCPKVAIRVIHDALLIHGHVGYSEEYPIEQRLRDVIGHEMADGTAEVMKIIILREILGREFLPY